MGSNTYIKKVIYLLYFVQHPDIVPDLPDRDGSNALQHAR